MRDGADMQDVAGERVIELRGQVGRTLSRIRQGDLVSADELRLLSRNVDEANILCNLLNVDFGVQGLPA